MSDEPINAAPEEQADPAAAPAAIGRAARRRREPAALQPAAAAPAPFAGEAGPVSLIPPAAVPAVTANEDITMDTVNTAETVADTATAKGQALFGEMNDRTKASMEKGARLLEEAAAFGKGNMEALVESSKIAAKGVESMGQDAADYARRSFEASTAAIRSLATVKSPTDFLKMQGDFMRQSFDTMVAETSRSTEAMLKLAGEVAQPLSNRMALAAEKIKVTG